MLEGEAAKGSIVASKEISACGIFFIFVVDVNTEHFDLFGYDSISVSCRECSSLVADADVVLREREESLTGV